MRTSLCPFCGAETEPATDHPGWYDCPACGAYGNNQEWMEMPRDTRAKEPT